MKPPLGRGGLVVVVVHILPSHGGLKAELKPSSGRMLCSGIGKSVEHNSEIKNKIFL